MDIETVNNFVIQLLDLVKQDEWSGQANISCSCHPEYRACCPQCGVEEKVRKHLDDCERQILIKKVNAFFEFGI
jgi:hypothetical protein